MILLYVGGETSSIVTGFWYEYLHSRRRVFIAYCVGIKPVSVLLQELTRLLISYTISTIALTAFVPDRISMNTGIFFSRLILPGRKHPIIVINCWVLLFVYKRVMDFHHVSA